MEINKLLFIGAGALLLYSLLSDSSDRNSKDDQSDAETDPSGSYDPIKDELYIQELNRISSEIDYLRDSLIPTDGLSGDALTSAMATNSAILVQMNELSDELVLLMENYHADTE